VKDSRHAASKTVRVSRETKKRSGGPAPASQATLDRVASEARERVARWLSETTLKPREGFLERIEKMAGTLALWGVHTNLTADASDPAEIAFHVIDSLAPMAFALGTNREALEAALAEGATALDLGSGAGFPGLVLAAAFGARFTLAETRRKRASYLQVAAHEMDLENVAVEQRRVSARGIAGGFDLVTARAFGTSAELYEIAAATLRPGGILLLYASADQVLDSGPGQVGSDQVLAEGATSGAIWTYGLPHGERVATRAAVLRRKPYTVSADR
jgi:16S rRNA (guanine527-N7)-methyltransferase